MQQCYTVKEMKSTQLFEMWHLIVAMNIIKQSLGLWSQLYDSRILRHPILKQTGASSSNNLDPLDKEQISFYKSSIDCILNCWFIGNLLVFTYFSISPPPLLDHDQFDLGVEFLNKNSYLSSIPLFLIWFFWLFGKYND